MTNILWPAALPQTLLLDGLQTRTKSSVLRTEMDAGPTKTRRRYTVSTKIFTGKLRLTSEQRLILERFYGVTLADGALRFAMKNPQTLEFEEFIFTEDYSESSIEGLWEISLSLERV